MKKAQKDAPIIVIADFNAEVGRGVDGDTDGQVKEIKEMTEWCNLQSKITWSCVISYLRSTLNDCRHGKVLVIRGEIK